MKYTTESVNPASRDIDRLSTPEMLEIINSEDARVAGVVRQAIPAIAAMTELVYRRLASGGRLFYVGAGTSARLAVMDAAECPPTYGVPAELVQVIIAGGPGVITTPVENAEDNEAAAVAAIAEHNITAADAVVGLSASGNTPFVRAALGEARRRGAATAVILCNETGRVTEEADVAVPLPTGAEVITGSTRMKAGTAQKMVLNMLSTCVMIRLGKVTGNFMTEMAPKNKKLQKRALFIVGSVCGIPEQEAAERLRLHQGNIRQTILNCRGEHHA